MSSNTIIKKDNLNQEALVNFSINPYESEHIPTYFREFIGPLARYISGWLPIEIFVWPPLLWVAAMWIHTIYRLFLKDKINLSVMFGLFYQSEQEPANLVDTNTLVSQILFSSSIVLLSGWLLYRFPEYIASPAVINIVTWAVYLLILPATLSLLFGTYILNYLKGDSDANSMLYAGIFDLSALLSFIIRFLVQLVRYFFIYVKMGLYVICTEEMFKTKEALDRILKNHPSDVCLPLQIFDDVCGLYYSLWHVVYKICDVVITYYTELGALSLVLFWLLKALYSYALPIVELLWNRHME